MTKQKSIILFLILIVLTFFIFLFTLVLSKFFIIESKANTPYENKDLVSKMTDVKYKSDLSVKKSFFTKNSKKVVYITFDDGPTPYTGDILKTLNKFKAGATFFVLGPNVKNYPKMVKLMVKEGYTVGCHGVSHNVHSFYKTAKSPKNEMDSCARTVKKVAGYKVNLIRTPYGSYPYLTKKQRINLEKANYIIWDWNVDSRDWTRPSMKKLVNSVISQVQTQSKKGHHPVILFHDKEITAKALPKILKKLQKMGYKFEPIDEYVTPVQF